MEATIDKSVIQKIQKCLALSESPNENEAALAAQRVQELLVKYNLSLAEINTGVEEEVQETVIHSGRSNPQWKQTLLMAISECNFTKFIISSWGREKDFVLIGKERNIIVTKNMYEYLVNAIERIEHQEYYGIGIGRTARISFRLGLVRGIASKLYEKKRAMTEQVETSDTTALVVHDLYKREKIEISEYIKVHYKDLKDGAKLNLNIKEDHYYNGLAKAKDIGLDDQVGGTSGKRIG